MEREESLGWGGDVDWIDLKSGESCTSFPKVVTRDMAVLELTGDHASGEQYVMQMAAHMVRVLSHVSEDGATPASGSASTWKHELHWR